MVKKLELNLFLLVLLGFVDFGWRQNSCVMAIVFLKASFIMGLGYPFSMNLVFIVRDCVLKS